MPARRNAPPPPNVSPLVAIVGVAGMVVAFYFRLPGFVVLLIALTIAGNIAVQPQFTGPKNRQGYQTAIDEREQKQMDGYRFWSDMKWRLLIPNSDWLPGLVTGKPRKSKEYVYPISLIWVIGIALAIITLAVPVPEMVKLAKASPDMEMVFRAVNALAAFSLTVVTYTSKRRAGSSYPAPTVTTDDLKALKGTDRAMSTVFAGGVFAGILAAAVLVYGAQYGLDKFAAPVPLIVPALGLFLLGYAGWMYLRLRSGILAKWRLLAEKRLEWDPLWEPLMGTKSKDGTPSLIDFEEVGMFEVITFDAPRTMGYNGILSFESKFPIALGGGREIAMLTMPNVDSSGNPTIGTKHPTQFRLVTFPSDEFVDFTDPDSDMKELGVAAEVVMVRVCAQAGLGRPIFLSLSPLFSVPEPEEDDEEKDEEDDDGETDGAEKPKRRWFQRKPKPDDSPDDQGPTYTAAWTTQWATPEGPPFSYLADETATFESEAGCEVAIDKRTRTQEIYFGALTAKTTPWISQSTAKEVTDIHKNIEWDNNWRNVFQGKTEFIPRRETGHARESTVNGRKINYQAFSMGKGVSLSQYRGYEPKLQIALNSAPVVGILGFKINPRDGERNPQGLVVVWSNDSQLPRTPEDITPGGDRGGRDQQGTEWLLSTILNRAFDEARKLARPEIISFRALTDPKSRGHIWEMKLRLYGGVTLAEVRENAQRIRQSMGVQWIRVIEDTYGCTIAAGIDPKGAGVKLLDRKTEKRIAELDFEQAFAMKGGVQGDGGTLPKMVSWTTLEKNPDVSVIDFRLPPGTSIERMRDSVKTVGPATSNAFIHVLPTEDPSVVRFLVAERNPLKNGYAPDWDEIERSSGAPFATGVDGAPVVFDPKDTNHLMILGLSGGGKSVTVQCLLYGALRRGWEVTVLNPVKGGGDYLFAEPYFYGSAFVLHDYFTPAAIIRRLYDEVTRRMNLLAAHKVTSYRDLPESVRPKHHLLILDEFTSLIQPDLVAPKTDDPELERERDLVIATNTAKSTIALYTGKVLREARASGFSIFLATQKLMAKSLDAIPGGGDMKSQLSRLLLGNASYGDKTSGLRNPEKAPNLGESIPPGRGIYEPSTGSPVIIQGWYARVEEYEHRLNETMTPVPEDQKYDYSAYLIDPDKKRNEEEQISIPDSFAEFDDVFGDGFDDEEEEVSGPDFTFSLDDIVAEPADDKVALPVVVESDGGTVGADTEAHVSTNAAEGYDSAIFLDVDGVLAPFSPTDETVPREIAGMGSVELDPYVFDRLTSLPAKPMFLSDWDTSLAQETFSEFSDTVVGGMRREPGEHWWKIHSLMSWLDTNPSIETVVWVDDKLGDQDESGMTNLDIVSNMMDDIGVRFLGVVTDPHRGVTHEDIASISAFLTGGTPPTVTAEDDPDEEDVTEIGDPFASFDDDADEEIEAPAENEGLPREAPPVVVDPKPKTRRSSRTASDDFFDFLDAPRVVNGRVGNTGEVEDETP